MSEEEKKEYVKKVISRMRYGEEKDGYFWLNDLHPILVMHPFKPDDTGKDMSSYELNGKKVYKEFARVASEQGEGFVEYETKKYTDKGDEKLRRKLSYVKYFEPWGWVIGTGIYLESKESQFKSKTLAAINSLRYGKEGNDYFYTMDTRKRTMIQHPNDTLIGKADTFFVDPDGKKQIVAQIDLALQEGEGYDHFKWNKMGEDEPQPKLSYVKHFKEWDMAIATGIYTDDVKKAVLKKEIEIEKNVRNQLLKLLLLIVCLIFAAVLIAYFIVFGGIVKPIRRMINMLKDIAEGEGDLTKRIVDDSGDETEEMANWFNQFISQIQNIIKDVSTNATILNRSSGELNTIAGGMASNAQQTSEKADTVAAAGEEMSSNMQSVAAAMEQAATNVNMVAAATEEISSTINEIASNTEKAREITGNAVSRTTSASDQVTELGTAAREIGNVVETITDISSQVDLLALNATIEAARAGEAGKGFAVVANEIKELARQTAEATMEIKNRVESIQNTTEGTVDEIKAVSKVVDEIDGIVSTIATAIEEQSATTQEIVSNVSQASVGLGEVNENVAQSSSVAGEIASDIADVNQASTGISDSCGTVRNKSEELSSLAENLNTMVNKFKVE